MKKLLLLCGLMVSPSLWAITCPVELHNELRMTAQQIEIHRTDQHAVITQQNELLISGQPIRVTNQQQAVLRDYRQQIDSILAETQQLTNKNLQRSRILLEDVAARLEAPGAFDNVQHRIEALFSELEARYHHQEQWVFPAQKFSVTEKEWQQEFERAQQAISQQFLSDAFMVIAQKMQRQGGMNLTELTRQMDDLKIHVTQRLNDYSQQLTSEVTALCSSLTQLQQQEQVLHQSIPRLKNFSLLNES
ncbi:DUF2884 family protein [Vibrio metschnikovii]|uniref:YggN family protein n=6 Tax=Unclassified Bacteria TaxID=49928 RepID=A0AAU6SW58_UNCXX|nr:MULTISPECIES: DUF2884 family protein [Vibrio]EKO3558747.1 DUF2884 family protein [Vibrio metschnikovii]EKO3559270.1 DUF2884 family protein [Vibrio metschnikovii]EKO3569250.1 DUF2884 family protein [Vibrio metschnikovii]EKO3576370.1 DUF2884 family protein [Vibrio metschnikovii]EKO3577304.1 DUF2884 family protein [Vibrio metschnikovii]